MDDDMTTDETIDDEIPEDGIEPRNAPATPSSITYSGSLIQDNWVTISWSSVSNALRYRVYCKINGTSTLIHINTPSHPTTSTDGKVPSNATHINFVVVAENNSGSSGERETGWYSVQAAQVQVPSTPSSISVSTPVNSGSYATISWSSVSGATSYLLDFRANGGSWDRIYSGSSASYQHYISSSYNTVQYDIAAQNSAGTSGWRTSSQYNVTHPTPSPSAPSSLNVSTPIRSGASTTISWSSSTHATSYVLQVSINSGSYSQIYSGSSTSYSHSITSSMDTVQYRVDARNSTGASAWVTGSNIGVYHPATTPSSLSVPNLIRVGYTITISWGTSSYASSYVLQCSTNGGTWSNHYSGSSTSTTHAITSSMNTLRYRVYATNALGDASGTRTGDTVNVNHPPTTPPSLDVPTPIKGGTTITISWGQSTDPNGDAITYELQCATNGGAYSALYSGANRTYNHTITSSMTTLQYRVRAKDEVDLYSDWRTGSAITVQQNTAPLISGSDTNLGTVAKPPTVTYTVTDPDSEDAVKAVLTLNGTTLWQADPIVLGQQYSFTPTITQFYGLASGQHTIKITATDKAGESAVRTYTFTRAIANSDFQLKPIPTPNRARLIQAYPRYLGEPAKVQVKVCNNALDASPTWETVGKSPEHIFTNTTCASGTWAISARVAVTPSANATKAFCTGVDIIYQ